MQSEDYISAKVSAGSDTDEAAKLASKKPVAFFGKQPDPFIFPSCASVCPPEERFFHARQLSVPVSSARLLRYQSVVDEVVNGRIGERNAHIRSRTPYRRGVHAGEGATIRDRPIVASGK